MNDLTLRKLKSTSFPLFYKNINTSTEISNEDKIKLLQIGIILLNSEDEILAKLGYRLILKYSITTNDYIPLYDIAVNKGFIPISKFIESKHMKTNINEERFMFQFISSYEENFRKNDVYLTMQQLELMSFFNEMNEESISVVAPTSYGKSELIMTCIESNPDSNICILVPTKSLLAQTKRRIISYKVIQKKRKLITHPEMYLKTDSNIVAVVTQERLLRLLQHDKALKFDYIIIDEAHNLLSSDSRANLLASAIIISKSRNMQCKFKYLTPFIINPSNLNISFINNKRTDFQVSENIKSEYYFYVDIASKSPVQLYDQYMNDNYKINDDVFHSDIEFIKVWSAEKNVLYLNKPTNIELFSDEMMNDEVDDIDNELIDKAISDIGEYIHKEYKLCRCIRKGFVYHHGSVPDNIRLYVENLFNKVNQMKYIVTSSTLLEGVNIPADRLFLLEIKKGNRNLSHAQFKNLVGRVSRFGDVFDNEKGSLEKLQPRVFW